MRPDHTCASTKSSAARLSHTVECVLPLADNRESDVAIGGIIEAGGERGALPPILLVALVAAMSLSGIPGVSVVCGLLIAFLSFGLIANFRSLHLPGKLKRMSIDVGKLRGAIGKIQTASRWIDRHTGARLGFLFHRPMIWVPQVLCVLRGMAMWFREFIPFSSSIVATGGCLLVMAMLTRDGIFAISALVPCGGLIYLLTKVHG